MSTTEERIYVGDSGTRFEFTVVEESVPVDLTGYVSLLVRFQRPDKTVFDRTLEVVDAVAGEVRYTTEDGELDQAGRWKFQLILEIPTWNGYATVGSFWVYDTL